MKERKPGAGNRPPQGLLGSKWYGPSRAGRKPGSHLSDPPGCPPTDVKTEAGPGHRSRRVRPGLGLRRLSLDRLRVAGAQGHLPRGSGCGFLCEPALLLLRHWLPRGGGSALRFSCSPDFLLPESNFILSVHHSLIAAQSRGYTCGLWIQNLGSFPRSPPAS